MKKNNSLEIFIIWWSSIKLTEIEFFCQVMSVVCKALLWTKEGVRNEKEKSLRSDMLKNVLCLLSVFWDPLMSKPVQLHIGSLKDIRTRLFFSSCRLMWSFENIIILFFFHLLFAGLSCSTESNLTASVRRPPCPHNIWSHHILILLIYFQ